jgi:putative transposase
MGGGTVRFGDENGKAVEKKSRGERFFRRRAQQGGHAERKEMIDPKHKLPITRQAELVGISRAAVYYVSRPISEDDLALQRRIDELHLERPFAGSRMLCKLLRKRATRWGASTWPRSCGAWVMDWASRRILAFRLSNTLTADFCVEALEEATVRYGKPEIVNTDQGSHFTSEEFTTTLKKNGIAISMDGWIELANRTI